MAGMGRSVLAMFFTALWLQAILVSSAAVSPSGLRRRADISTPLRIMPLGDSITRGSMSSNTNGYRGPLQEKLAGVDFDFIGTLVDGTMRDRSHQGHSGKVISEIKEFSSASLGARPNVILLHAGTNDLDLQRDVPNAPKRLAGLIDHLADKCPDATILVAQIIGANKPELQARIDAFNTEVASHVRSRASDGKHIALVDMTHITGGDLADIKHPNDAGYAKMAAAWYEGILAANSKGWIEKPVKPEVTNGVGLNDGSGGGSGGGKCSGPNWVKNVMAANVVRIWDEKGQIFGGYETASLDNVHFADVTGDGIDDYLLVGKDGEVRAWKGTGSGYQSMGIIAPGPDGVDGRKVRFADLNGDGLADYIVLYDGGAARAWLNTGKVDTPDSPKWKEVGEIAKGVDGVSGDKVTFADVDGDGLADYVIVYDGGAVAAQRNLGNIGKDGQKWENMGTIAPGVSGVPGEKIRIVDFDGDGLADFLIIYDGGSVEFYRNAGNLLNDKSPKWEDVGIVAGGVNGATRKQVHFAHLDDDGLADYLILSENGAVTAYQNSGRTDRAEGVRFADLNGDNLDDIIYLHKDGSADAWINQGANPWSWRYIGRIAESPEGSSRDKVVFTDIDGDGLADYLIRFDGGAVKAFRNNGNLNSNSEGRNWDDLGAITNGVGAEGRKLQFADVDGDGLSDLLVVFDGGAVDAYKNNGLGAPEMFTKLGTIAGGVGAPGSKIRFADIDGDGTADYLVSYDGGAVRFYRNNGNLERDPAKPSWENLGVIAAGVQQQGIVIFGDLDGDGKADYLNVDRDSGSVNAYINNCAWTGEQPENPDEEGGNGGDDDEIPIPKPPPAPDSPIDDPAEFCSVINSNGDLTKTEEEWDSLNMDKQVREYTKRIDPWGKDVQYSLLSFYKEEIQEIVQHHCDPRSVCNLNINAKACRSNPALTFIMMAITNFSNFLENLIQSILDSHDIVNGKTANIVEKFMPKLDPTDDTTGGLGIASGLLSTVGAWVPPAAAAGGIFGFASSLYGVVANTVDPKTFETYAEVNDKLADSVRDLVNAIEEWGVKVLTEKPEKTGDDYVEDDEYGLPKILEGGSFAEERPVDSLPDGVIAGLTSPVINHLWNKQQVVIIKANEFILAKDPCDGGVSGISDDAIWCDDNGVAHILMTWPSGKFDLARQKYMEEALAVTGVESLKDYDITIEMIRAAADRSQADRGYLPDGDDVEYTKDVLLSGDGDLSPDKLVSFTLPVCDIRDLDWDGIHCVQDASFDADLCWLYRIAFEKCPGTKAKDQDWPYDTPTYCTSSCNHDPGFCQDRC